MLLVDFHQVLPTAALLALSATEDSEKRLLGAIVTPAEIRNPAQWPAGDRGCSPCRSYFRTEYSGVLGGALLDAPLVVCLAPRRGGHELLDGWMLLPVFPVELSESLAPHLKLLGSFFAKFCFCCLPAAENIAGSLFF